MSRQNKHGLKGPFMPSMKDQTGRNKKVLVWTPGTQSTRQQKRNLRNKARAVIDSDDPAIIAAGDRVLCAVCGEPDPEFSALHLFNAAIDMADSTGESWATCMNYVMDKFDAMPKEIPPGMLEAFTETTDAPTAKRDSGRSRLRGLLRTLIPRSLRARYERSAEADQHQRAGDVDGEPSTGERHDPAEADSSGAGEAAEARAD
jgi:hypothetical protein